MFKVPGVEIMPVKKSCEQGCPKCPLSSRSREIIETNINEQVQETFSTLESYLKKIGINYDLHFTSKMDLFPEMKYPELIRMARFETNRNISLEGQQKIYSDKIQQTLNLNNIDPKHVCFSFVPQSPVITDNDIKIIRTIIQEISGWFLQNKINKKLSCTIRSNFIPEEKFRILQPELREKDENNLRAIFEELLPNQKLSKGNMDLSLTHGNEDLFAQVYFSSFQKQIKGNNIEVSNRVFCHKDIQKGIEKLDLENNKKFIDYNMYQVIQNIKGIKNPPGFLISPEGIMINHASDIINNPMFWITHKDFKKLLQKNKNQSPHKITKKILTENLIMYNAIHSKLQRPKGSKKDYMQLFEEYRNMIRI